MLKLNTRLAAIVALAIGAITSPAYADIVIDDFNSFVQINRTSIGTSDADGTVASILGGVGNYRLDFQAVAGPPPSTQTAALSVDSGFFSLDTGTGADARMIARYDGTPGFGISSPGLDMTIPAFDGFRFTYVSGAEGFTAIVNIYDTSGNLVSTANQNFPGADEPGTVAFIGKGSFSNASVFNSAIGAIEFIFDPPKRGDLKIDGPLVAVTTVPEPSSIALVASTLIPGALIWRSRRKKTLTS